MFFYQFENIISLLYLYLCERSAEIRSQPYFCSFGESLSFSSSYFKVLPLCLCSGSFITMFLAWSTFHFFCLEFVVPLEYEAQFLFFVFCLGNSLAIISSVKASDLPLHYCLQLHAPWVSGKLSILSVTSLLCEGGRCGPLGFSWRALPWRSRRDTREHRRPCSMFSDKLPLPWLWVVADFPESHLNWKRKSLTKGQLRTTPYW